MTEDIGGLMVEEAADGLVDVPDAPFAIVNPDAIP